MWFRKKRIWKGQYHLVETDVILGVGEIDAISGEYRAFLDNMSVKSDTKTTPFTQALDPYRATSATA